MQDEDTTCQATTPTVSMLHHDWVNTSETVSQNETLLFYLCRVCCHTDKKSAYANALAVNTNTS